jgi:hypothetical protein
MMRRIEILAGCLLLAACGGVGGAVPPQQQSFVARVRHLAGANTHFTVSGRYISLDGARFFVKGVDYSPTPIGKVPNDPPGLDDPLRDGNETIWSRDLPKIRAMGANAIHVYNVVPPGHDQHTGPITKFLNAAWNGGDRPVYVIMTIYFAGDALKNAGAAADLANQYRKLDEMYAKYPAVMGVALGNEITTCCVRDANWWKNFNVVAKGAKQGFAAGGNRDKLVITSEIDDNIESVHYGEINNAAVDAWGVNIYRGRTFTNLFAQIKQYTAKAPKPVLLTEYGASAGYHIHWKNTYTWAKGPNGLGECHPDKRDGPLDRDVAELPPSSNPDMAGLVDYVDNNASQLYSGYKNDAGIVSGGFYFEWTDEWWKALAGDPSRHLGNENFSGAFPGCSYDQGWFGLNSVAKGNGDIDKLTPRPTLANLEEAWKGQL